MGFVWCVCLCSSPSADVSLAATRRKKKKKNPSALHTDWAGEELWGFQGSLVCCRHTRLIFHLLAFAVETLCLVLGLWGSCAPFHCLNVFGFRPPRTGLSSPDFQSEITERSSKFLHTLFTLRCEPDVSQWGSLSKRGSSSRFRGRLGTVLLLIHFQTTCWWTSTSSGKTDRRSTTTTFK